ncbi:MAG: hypothetical protein ACXADS_12020, partial [Candidatus Thorarchaeota archaeon]
MNKEGFQEFLKGREIPSDEIERSILIVERFDDFVKGLDRLRTVESVTSDDAAKFTTLLIDEEINSYENFVALVRYGRFVKNNDLYLAFLELIDGGNVIDVLHERLGETVGKEKRDEVFRGIDMPPLGMSSSEKPTTTKALMDQMEDKVDPETCKKVLSDVAHGISKEHYKGERER